MLFWHPYSMRLFFYRPELLVRAKQLKPFLEGLAARAPYYISAYPNAGLPNSLGQYDQTPEEMASEVKEYIDEGLVNIIGGCCGTTEEYIAKYQELIVSVLPGYLLISLPPLLRGCGFPGWSCWSRLPK